MGDRGQLASNPFSAFEAHIGPWTRTQVHMHLVRSIGSRMNIDATI